jgi:hypothetical protein
MAAGTRRHFTPWPSIKPVPAAAAAPVLVESLDQIYFELSLFLLFGLLAALFSQVCKLFSVYIVYYVVVC